MDTVGYGVGKMKTLSLNFLIIGLMALMLGFFFTIGKNTAPAPIVTKTGLHTQAEKCLALEVTDSCRMGDGLFVKIAEVKP
jgi:hypothetical protein